jgi:hypothetical protein
MVAQRVWRHDAASGARTPSCEDAAELQSNFHVATGTFTAMLTEQFVAAISASTKPNTGVTKDAGIFIHEFQPLAAQRHVFKKSATAPNGIALSASHVFAAQADKAILHIYSREKGNQEAIVPFPERIHSVALAAQGSVLLLGTESGRILAWEVSRRPHAANTLQSL